MKNFLHALSRALTWCRILQKRILKKPAFLVILVLMPLLAGGLSAVAGDNSGVMAAAVWWDTQDAYANAFGEELLSQKTAIRMIHCETEEEARRLVDDGTVSAAWIFSESFEDHLKNFVNNKDETVTITIVEREENALLNLSRDRLFSMMFPRISYALFRERVLAMGVEPEPTEEVLLEYYDNTAQTADLLQFLDMRGNTVQVNKFLLSPVRGILSLLIVEGGVAAAIFCAEDERAGVFQRLSKRRQILVKFVSILLPMVDLSVAAILSLWVTGLLGNIFYEILLHLLFLPAAGGFCLFLLALLRTPKRLGLAAFFTVLATLALTPVFMDVAGMGFLPSLIPTHHYIRGVMISSSLPWLPVYAAVACGLSLVLFAIPRRED